MRLLMEVVEGGVEADVDMVVVVVVVVSTVTLPMMRTHSLPLLVKVLLKEKPGSPQKSLVMVGLVVLIVVVAAEVSTMEKMVKMGAHEEYLNAAVGLDTGECYT